MKTIKRITPIGIELQLYGVEKVWNDSAKSLKEQLSSDDSKKLEQIRCFNFYNNQCSEKDARNFVEIYLNTLEKTPEGFDLIKNASDQEFYGPLAWLCRMSSIGYVLSKSDLFYMKNEFQSLIESAKSKSLLRKIFQRGESSDIQQRTTEAINKTIAEFDNMIDEFVASKCKEKFDIYQFLKTNNIKQIYAKRIAEVYTEELREIKEVIRGKDEQLNEGYSNFKPREIQKLHDFMQKIIDDAKAWADNIKKSKSPRKKKVKSADQLVQKLKYIKSDTDLHLTSIEPSKIIGSSEVWIFNVKTRRIDHYFADGPAGISVKGTTLQNFNETTSIAKKIRKPLEISKNIVIGTARNAIKYFDSIKTKPMQSNGRLNEYSLILRIV